MFRIFRLTIFFVFFIVPICFWLHLDAVIMTKAPQE